MITLNSRFCSTLIISPSLFYIEKFTAQFKATEKNDRSLQSDIVIQSHGQNIERVSSFCYLGVTLDEHIPLMERAR